MISINIDGMQLVGASYVPKLKLPRPRAILSGSGFKFSRGSAKRVGPSFRYIGKFGAG